MISLIERISGRLWKILCGVVAASVLGGCFLPPAANLQDARMVGKGNVRVTGFWSGLNDTGEDGEKVADEYGAMLGFGSSDRTEIQVRFERIAFADGDDGYQFLSIGPKFGLVEDRLALLVPGGVYVGEDIGWVETIQFQPALMGSLPVSRNFEFNTAARFILPLDPDLFTWFNVGFGVGLSSDLDRWAILPEVSYSICLDEGEVDPIFSYGVALVFLPGD